MHRSVVGATNAVPHAGIDAPESYALGHVNVAPDLGWAALQREKLSLPPKSRRHLVHDSTRRPNDTILNDLA
jgi:hypothetical protein